MIHQYDTNQTQFAEEEVLFQNVTTPQMPQVPVENEQAQPKKKKKVLIIGASVFGVFLLLILVLMIVGRKPQVEQVLEASPSPSPTIVKDNPLRDRVENLQDELTEADPSNQTLVFPPVNMSIQLDPIQN
ncbi:MAG: hypothetical protein H6773_01755 [Pseudomonadales bacterium]|nr:hypothetical protein [Candidatus Woesebacteria bacterium]MCB9800882.1 hypothetical protein [Pseudomonadales bacterium]